jgi:hypothetical protein
MLPFYYGYHLYHDHSFFFYYYYDYFDLIVYTTLKISIQAKHHSYYNRFLETETTDKLSESMLKPIRSMQMHAADLLYLIISKLDYVNIKLVQKIQTGTLSKLLFCIATHNLDLQQKLLHLLHATLAITAASAQQNKDKPQRRKGSIDMLEYHYEPSKTHQEQQHQYTDAVALMRSSSDLFVKCATDALIERSNHPMLQHWMDFLQASLPYVQNNFRHVIVPLIMCVCNQINILAQEISILMHGSSDDISLDGSPEKDMVVLLTGLEKMVMFSLTERLTDDWYPTDIKLGCAMPIPNIPDSSGLIGLANLVHSDDPPRMNERVSLFVFAWGFICLCFAIYIHPLFSLFI